MQGPKPAVDNAAGAAGGNECQWSHRTIYLPALPCSTQSVEGLLQTQTHRGEDERGKYELSSREPELQARPLGLWGGSRVAGVVEVVADFTVERKRMGQSRGEPHWQS